MCSRLKRLSALVLAATVVSVGVVHAQSPSRYFGSIGVVSPRLDGLEEAYGPSVSVAGGIEMPINSILALRGEVGLSRFAVDESGLSRELAVPAGYTIEGGGITAISGFVNALASLPSSVVSPYAFGGLGLVTFQMDAITLRSGGLSATSDAITMDDALAFDVGIGVSASFIPKLKLFGEAKQIRTFGGDRYVPIHIGAVLSLD